MRGWGCVNHKLTRFVERQIEAKPKLVQITTSRVTQTRAPQQPRGIAWIRRKCGLP